MRKMKMPHIDKDKVRSFIAENKTTIAVVGGVAAGIAVISILGKERSKQLLSSLGSSVKDISGSIVKDFGSFKDLLSPLLSKIPTQGL
jgi:hypothetical protein